MNANPFSSKSYLKLQPHMASEGVLIYCTTQLNLRAMKLDIQVRTS